MILGLTVSLVALPGMLSNGGINRRFNRRRGGRAGLSTELDNIAVMNSGLLSSLIGFTDQTGVLVDDALVCLCQPLVETPLISEKRAHSLGIAGVIHRHRPIRNRLLPIKLTLTEPRLTRFILRRKGHQIPPRL